MDEITLGGRVEFVTWIRLMDIWLMIYKIAEIIAFEKKYREKNIVANKEVVKHESKSKNRGIN